MNTSIGNRTVVLLFYLALCVPPLTLAQDKEGSAWVMVPNGDWRVKARIKPGTPSFSGCSLLGTVTDADEALMPGVKITAVNLRTRISRTDHTDTASNFVFTRLVPGRYQVTADAQGFPRAKTELSVVSGRATIVYLLLKGKYGEGSFVAIPEGERRPNVTGRQPTPKSGARSGGGKGASSAAVELKAQSGVPRVAPSQIISGAHSGGGKGASSAVELKPRSGVPGVVAPSQVMTVLPKVAEVFEMTFDSETKLQEWLNEQNEKRTRLLAVVPIRDATSLFVLAESGYATSASLVLPVSNSLTREELSTRVGLYPDKTFVGVHRVSDKLFLIVFQYRSGSVFQFKSSSKALSR
jgi:hypothetical protein